MKTADFLQQTITSFNQQLSFAPQIENRHNLQASRKFLVVGMGGSHLAAHLVKAAKPELDLIIHSGYELPQLADLAERLIIISSYSGQPEETLDAFRAAQAQHLNLAVITGGGELLEMAKAAQTAFIQIPQTAAPARMMVGYSLMAHLAVMGQDHDLRQLGQLAASLQPLSHQQPAEQLAAALGAKIPLIYASASNAALALNWKVNFNETAGLPAFYNVLPELAHNELAGFSDKQLNQNLHVLLLLDQQDDQRIKIEFARLAKQLQVMQVSLSELSLVEPERWASLINNLLLTFWTSLKLAEQKGSLGLGQQVIDQFKKQ